MEKKSKTTQEILDFWTLCEIVDFERLNFHKDEINEYYTNNTQSATKSLINERKVSIKYKKTTIHRVYIGLIRSDETIKFIYKKLEQRGLLPKNIKSDENSDLDIEKIPTFNDFTYMAYVYVDSNNRLIEVGGKSIKINPLFYILKSLLEKSIVNTTSYNEYIEKIDNRFCEDYGIVQEVKPILIPDAKWLLGSGSFETLQAIKDCEIYIIDDLEDELRKLSIDNNKAKKELETLEKERENSETIFKFQKEGFTYKTIDHYLELATKIANKFFYKNIYLITTKEKVFDEEKIPINLYITSYIDENIKLYPSIVYSKDKKLTQDIQKEIFEKLCIDLYLTDQHENIADIFYKDYKQELSIFEKRFFNIKFQEIKQIEDDEFLSYYINALDEEPSSMTGKYIFGTPKRVDINQYTKTRKDYNSFELFKNISAKWASPYPLYYAQQMAVNNFMKNIDSNDNIFSVNGPPGTGKTTLLKDIIADTITKRVEHCIRLNGVLFEDGLLKDELCGIYEIVVSSNNNAAVENITRELPRVEEFDFKHVGVEREDFLLGKFCKEFYGFDAWGLISINLGNQENIKNFTKKFDTLCKSIEETNLLDTNMLLKKKDELTRKFIENKKLIETYNQEFIDLHKEEIIDEKYRVKLKELDQIKQDKENLAKSINQLETKIDEIKNSIKNINISEKRAEQIISLKEEELKSFGFFATIFKRKEINKIKKEITKQKSILSQTLITLQDSEKDLEKLLQRSKQEDTNIKAFNSKEVEIQREYNLLKMKFDNIQALKEKYQKYNINNDTFYSKTEEEIQKSSLYNHTDYLQAKSKQFALSMLLSEVFFLLNFQNFSKSIKDFTTDHKKTLDTKSKNKLKKDFAAFFMLLPAISTSLASSHNMLKNIENFSIFICDESGQATPQSLVGLLNRAKNAMIVGDPLQVKPVFTAPSILVKLIQNMYDIDDMHSPISTSAQILADNANSIGSYYKIDDQDLWVGMPLVVHRRCVDPMFSISNKISYNNKMVLSTPPIKDDDPINSLPPSGWIDVVSQEFDFDGNISLEEIKKLKEFINQYKQVLKDDYYIISPFRGLSAKKYKLKHNDNSNKDKDKDKGVGTVHTFQGKEADVVFFILGGNVSREGAKGWVSSEANILNVATTRAKKRIYFIGDKLLWKGHRFFKDTIDILTKES